MSRILAPLCNRLRLGAIANIPTPVVHEKQHLPFLSELAHSQPRLGYASVIFLTHKEVALHLWNFALQ